MNVRLVIILLAAILLAHAVLIHLLLKTGDIAATKSAADLRNDEPFIPPEPIRQEPGEKTHPELRTQPERPAPVIEQPRPGKKNPVWRPLNYKNAIRGNIGSIPASRGAGAGILVNLNTRQVLWTKNEKYAYPIASMSKLMTLMLAYEDALDRVKYPAGLETVVTVTHEASLIPPSKVYLAPGEKFTLKELMLAAAIKSANDAAGMVAIFLGDGKMSNFVARMNERAAELKMTSTKFFGPHGLPGKNKNLDNRSSAEDMVRLCEAYMQYDELMEWSAIRRKTFRNKGQKNYLTLINHNNLLPGARYAVEGVTGLKTGFTNRAGFCLAVTCTRNGETLLGIFTGFRDLKGRDSFGKAVLEWGFRRSADLKKRQ